jgi:thymidine phosphorylase
VLERLDALAVGIAAWRLGAGRARKEDAVQAGAGVQLHAKPGDRVEAGDVLFTLHTDTPERLARARDALQDSWSIGEHPADRPPLIIDRIG